MAEFNPNAHKGDGQIIHKINHFIANDKPFFSFEYFPPKTEKGIENLNARILRMVKWGPMFMDCTWGAGGSTATATLDISLGAQK